MRKYIENIKKNIFLITIFLVAAWWNILRINDSSLYTNIGYVALFLVILFYGLILYLIYKNDRFSKLLKVTLYTIYSLYFFLSCYVLLTSVDIFYLIQCIFVMILYWFQRVLFMLYTWYSIEENLKEQKKNILFLGGGFSLLHTFL